MRLVLDSSAAMRAAMSTEAGGSLSSHDLIAPPILWSEVYSAVHAALWRRDIDASLAVDLLERFGKLGVRRRAPSRLYREAYDIATDLGWAKSYDAEFLALARLESGRVLTTDALLLRGAQRTGLVMSPAELT